MNAVWIVGPAWNTGFIKNNRRLVLDIFYPGVAHYRRPGEHTKNDKKYAFFFLVNKVNAHFLEFFQCLLFDFLFLTFWEPKLNHFISRLLFNPLFSPFFWSPSGDSNPAPSESQQKLLTARPTGTHVIAG